MAFKFTTKNSAIEGKGVFATAFIKAGETIGTFQGERITIPELKRRYKTGTERICDPLQISERLYLDLHAPWVFLNHCCEPNAGIKGSTTLFALTDIQPGEEITFDYATTEWTWKHFGQYCEWEMVCQCGKPACRKKIEQFPTLPKDRVAHYAKLGALPNFIKRKLKKHHETA
jgi:hypothetical protein